MAIEKQTESENAAEFDAQEDDVFGRIATRYDLLCDLFSFGIHRLWKQKAAVVIAREPWSNLLDCASGTGDIILRILRSTYLQYHQTMVISDVNPQMLSIARKRLESMGQYLEFQLLDVHSMPRIPSSSIDLYSISLGLKICKREKVLREALRILRPGGRLVVLESSNITPAWLQKLYLRYMKVCMPIIGWVATGGDSSAYKYLLKGIEEFPTAEAFVDELTSMGFEDVSFERLSLGIVAIHVARKSFHSEI